MAQQCSLGMTLDLRGERHDAHEGYNWPNVIAARSESVGGAVTFYARCIVGCEGGFLPENVGQHC